MNNKYEDLGACGLPHGIGASGIRTESVVTTAQGRLPNGGGGTGLGISMSAFAVSDSYSRHLALDAANRRLAQAESRNASLTDLLARTLAYYTESCFPEDLLIEVKAAIGSVDLAKNGEAK